MLRMIYEKYGNDPKCEKQVKGGCLNLIHKTLTLHVQVEAKPTTRMI